MNINDIAGKMVKVGKTSITVKDEYNKTRGIVKNICTWNILPPRQQGDYFRLINICNIRNAKPELLEKCVLVVEGEFLKFDMIMQQENEYSITLDRENLKEIMKYNIDLNKTENKNRFGVVFYHKDGKLYSYTKTSRYAAFDEIVTTENTMNKDFCIRFNPLYWMDILKTIDTETIHCEGKYSPVSGWMVTGKEYQFFVLPIHLGTTQEKITEELEKYFQ